MSNFFSKQSVNNDLVFPALERKLPKLVGGVKRNFPELNLNADFDNEPAALFNDVNNDNEGYV